jgi:Acetyltransferases
VNQIRTIQNCNLPILVELLHESFYEIVKQYGITKENSEHNAAFITLEELQYDVDNGLELSGLYLDDLLIGSIGIKQKEKDKYYIERLCIHPSYRHQKYGSTLLEYGKNKVINRGGRTISIGIIDENIQLKKWYIQNGYSEIEIKRIKYLPFSVCIMEYRL